jgi:hypothetical protein
MARGCLRPWSRTTWRHLRADSSRDSAWPPTLVTKLRTHPAAHADGIPQPDATDSQEPAEPHLGRSEQLLPSPQPHAFHVQAHPRRSFLLSALRPDTRRTSSYPYSGQPSALDQFTCSVQAPASIQAPSLRQPTSLPDAPTSSLRRPLPGHPPGTHPLPPNQPTPDSPGSSSAPSPDPPGLRRQSHWSVPVPGPGARAGQPGWRFVRSQSTAKAIASAAGNRRASAAPTRPRLRVAVGSYAAPRRPKSSLLVATSV